MLVRGPCNQHMSPLSVADTDMLVHAKKAKLIHKILEIQAKMPCKVSAKCRVMERPITGVKELLQII